MDKEIEPQNGGDLEGEELDLFDTETDEMLLQAMKLAKKMLLDIENKINRIEKLIRDAEGLIKILEKIGEQKKGASS